MFKPRGFTLAEIAVVVATLAILATIVVTGFKGYEKRAQAAQAAAALDSTNKALESYARKNNWNAWQQTGEVVDGYSFSGDPSIHTLTQQLPGFSAYLPQAPTISGITTSNFKYDSDPTDPSSKNPSVCNTTMNEVSAFYGTNLLIHYVDATVAQRVDEQIDDGNLLCGRVRMSTYSGFNELIYMMSPNDVIE